MKTPCRAAALSYAGDAVVKDGWTGIQTYFCKFTVRKQKKDGGNIKQIDARV